MCYFSDDGRLYIFLILYCILSAGIPLARSWEAPARAGGTVRPSQYKSLSSIKAGQDGGEEQHQRHILKDRRPSTAACPASWEKRTKEFKKIVYGEEKNILFWAK